MTLVSAWAKKYVLYSYKYVVTNIALSKYKRLYMCHNLATRSDLKKEIIFWIIYYGKFRNFLLPLTGHQRNIAVTLANIRYFK